MTLSDLPEIQITPHAKATRLRLRVEPNQIRLTVPKYCTQRQIQDFLQQSEQWMIETWHKQQTQQGLVQRELPNQLSLFNLPEPLNIHYHTQKHSFILDLKQHCLWVSDRQPAAYLKAFVIAYAKQMLPIYLQTVSHEIALPFKQCAIRQPKTRWGSCSTQQHIMLNSALVLFPEQIVRYVAVHELAHTRHFDHSPAFWVEVQRHDAHYLQHRKQLKTTSLPWWWYQ
ncbi:M48 family metallopeptidase [Acinetobacter sp. YH01003]|uniref:M48 family metallopeptidase n=1 Tax=Acinetobacter sp. YH01003 TaxID=2601019 RepID=UPI0015D12B3A|nr:SprT family zinc-dependent metalloprotease [Acinetobacter sp. YH01003]